MIDDPMLVPRARDLIAEQQVNAEWAVQRAFEDLSGIFDGIEDAYLRERRGDVADVVGRLRMNLGRARGRGADLFRDVETDSVLIADELTPSMAAQVDWRKIQGFASDTGSRTHHTAILARSLHVPAVVGLGLASSRIQPGVIGRHRRDDGRGHRRPARRTGGGGPAAQRRAGRARRAAGRGGCGLAVDAGRRLHHASGEHRPARTTSPSRAIRGRRRHRALPVRVPPGDVVRPTR